MNLTNYHSHSTFCDGHSSMEEFVVEAINQGFSSYGFSSHAPLPYHTRWNMDAENMNAYLSEFKRLKELYSSEIELYLGLEIDYLTESYNAMSECFRSLDLDYRIGSLHTIIGPDEMILEIDCSLDRFTDIVDSHFSGDVVKVTNLYIDRLMLMVANGGFDIVGHADKMHSLSEQLMPGISSQSWYQSRMKEYFSLIAEKGYMVEMNTKKYNDKGLFFPHVSWYPFLRQLGVPVVVNSDSHYIDKINNGRASGLQLLKSCGYETVREMHGGKWVDVVIDV
ncbi:MAG: histidinol-phosphatase [Bacteroidales bacterium]|nr:histidinol-phosphatase [Bacteroidales bacterium]